MYMFIHMHICVHIILQIHEYVMCIRLFVYGSCVHIMNEHMNIPCIYIYVRIIYRYVNIPCYCNYNVMVLSI